MIVKRDAILERNGDSFSVDAALMAELLNVPPSRVQALMRRNEITVCGVHAPLIFQSQRSGADLRLSNGLTEEYPMSSS